MLVCAPDHYFQFDNRGRFGQVIVYALLYQLERRGAGAIGRHCDQWNAMNLRRVDKRHIFGQGSGSALQIQNQDVHLALTHHFDCVRPFRLSPDVVLRAQRVGSS